MVRDIPTRVITDVRDPSKDSGIPAFAHLNLCPANYKPFYLRNK